MLGEGGNWISAKASGAITAYRFVKGTTTDKVVSQAASGQDSIVGVGGHVGAADGDMIDYRVDDITQVEYGGVVAFGDPLTSDSLGRAVLATASDFVVGYAHENVSAAGIIGDICLSFNGSATIRPLVTAMAAFDGGNNTAPTAVIHKSMWTVPATAAASTVTLPNPAAPNAPKDGTELTFQADGVLNAHTVTYRDATGTVVLTAAATASKRHRCVATYAGGKWAASLAVMP